MGFKKGHPPYEGTEKTRFKKGDVPWNKNKELSLETRRKISEARKGRAPWNKGKKAPQISVSKMGSKHPMWKGGTYDKCLCGSSKQRRSPECRSCANKGNKSPFYKDGRSGFNRTERQNIMTTAKYRHWRIAVFKRDSYICQMCNERGGKLQVDHIKSFYKYPKLRFDIKNGRTLCVECHKRTPNFGIKAIFEEGGGAIYA